MARRTVGLCLALAAALAAGGEVALEPALVAARNWGGGAEGYRTELVRLVTGERLPEAKQAARAFANLALCQFLASAGEASRTRAARGRDVVDWLLSNPRLAATLALAVRPEDHAGRVLAVLREIMPRGARAKVTAPGMYVAFAVVWDRRVQAAAPPPKRAGPAPDEGPNAALRRHFAHYADNARRMWLDLKRLPWQMAVFVVDSSATDAERQWALDHYGASPNFEQLYTLLPDDVRLGRWTGRVPRTLDNLAWAGAGSVDRAAFAGQVAKACGQPCIALRGPSRVGVDQRWVAVLEGAGTPRLRWTLHGPAPKGHGTYADPQTGVTRSLSDARLLARTLSLPPDRRREAEAWFRVAERLRGRLPPARALLLLKQAVSANPHDARAWLLLSDMMAAGEAPRNKAGALYRFLLGRFRRYPEFTRDILHALLPLIPEDAVRRRQRVYEATFAVYQKQPAVVAALMTELAEYLRARGKTGAAAATCRSVIRQFRGQGHLVARALDMAEAIYRERRLPDRVIEMYEEAFDPYRAKEAEALAHGTDSHYYRLAAKLAKLHREAGNRRAAAAYDARRDRFLHLLDQRRRGTRRLP